MSAASKEFEGDARGRNVRVDISIVHVGAPGATVITMFCVLQRPIKPRVRSTVVPRRVQAAAVQQVS